MADDGKLAIHGANVRTSLKKRREKKTIALVSSPSPAPIDEEAMKNLGLQEGGSGAVSTAADKSTMLRPACLSSQFVHVIVITFVFSAFWRD